MFKKRVLNRIFGPKRDEVTGGRRKMHNEELRNFVLFAKYNYNGQVKEDKMGRGMQHEWWRGGTRIG